MGLKFIGSREHGPTIYDEQGAWTPYQVLVSPVLFHLQVKYNAVEHLDLLSFVAENVEASSISHKKTPETDKLQSTSLFVQLSDIRETNMGRNFPPYRKLILITVPLRIESRNFENVCEVLSEYISYLDSQKSY